MTLPSFALHDQRAREVFRKLVDVYLETGLPVGSRTLSRVLSLSLSSASIRNVMMDLEEQGLISSPYTSAGRIPTQVGLRFFVDALMEVGAIDPQERAQIDQQLNKQQGPHHFEDILRDATNLLSGLSDYAGVVVAPKLNACLKHVEFVNLSPGRALVILVSEDGTVENRLIDLPAGLPLSTLIRAGNYLSTRFCGKTLEEVQLFVREEMEKLLSEVDELAAKVIETGLATWSSSSSSEHELKTLIIKGQAKLLENMGVAEDLDRLRMLFDDIENKKELVGLLDLAEAGEGVRIFIGSENRLFSLSGSSFIVAPYRDGREKIVGALGIIGPTRMNYARIIPMVDYTAKAIHRLLT